MKRRTLLAGLAAAPHLPAAAAPANTSLKFRSQRLNLRHTWTTVMSSSQFRETFVVEYARDGLTGLGEGAPIVRYQESAQQAIGLFEQHRGWLEQLDPWAYQKSLGILFQKIPGNYAAKAAFDIALFDWLGKRLQVPVHRLFGLDAKDAPLTTFSIGIDKAEVIKQKMREADEYPVLKIKVGLDNDEEVLDAVRSVTKKPLRVDANEGFKSKEEAVRKINWLEKMGVEFIEQPLPAANLEDMNWIRKRVHMPIIADEACLHPADVPRLAPHFDGVNVKVDKCGGLLEAQRMITLARALNLKVMIGCMISSSIAITAAAHISPLVDYADLDGFLLIANDPYRGVTAPRGRLTLPTTPGLGLA